MTNEAKKETLWKETRCDTWDELNAVIGDLLRHANGRLLAWRGQSDQAWRLQTTLDRRLLPARGSDPTIPEYARWLEIEQRLLRQFQSDGMPFADEAEKRYMRADLDDHTAWNLLAIGRHYGLPTRVLDWTESPWIAAYFACIHESDADGAIWWFDQNQLEEHIDPQWGDWDVPTRREAYYPKLPEEYSEKLGLNQRAFEQQAFREDTNGSSWVTKVHYGIPFPRMQAQQAFMTVCRHLDMDHDAAIDEIDPCSTIKRGRIVVSAGMKPAMQQVLEHLNVNSRILQYPGLDDLARSIAKTLVRDRCRAAGSVGK